MFNTSSVEQNLNMFKVTPVTAGRRLVTGIGQSAGPVLVAAVVGVAGVGAAAVSVGALGVAGAGWLWYWLSSAPKGRQP
ncbi:hypothetical protein AB6N24_07050 [Cellulomonas sp. 179-A 4D5 NHS]